MKKVLLLAGAALAFSPLAAQQAPLPGGDVPPGFAYPADTRDYVKREVMIPMRDGVQLYTVIVVRKGVTNAPILLSRTPYDAAQTTMRVRSQSIVEILPVADAEFVNDGYIRVYQDVRGMHRSEGEYVKARPLRGPLNKTRADPFVSRS